MSSSMVRIDASSIRPAIIEFVVDQRDNFRVFIGHRTRLFQFCKAPRALRRGDSLRYRSESPAPLLLLRSGTSP
jgi:hypothetical protein